jgi:hypothetical protein
VTQPDQLQLQRMRYLQEMGIAVWYPRAQLPGAANSAVTEWQFDTRHPVRGSTGDLAGSREAPVFSRREDGVGKAATVRQVLSADAGQAQETGQNSQAGTTAGTKVREQATIEHGVPREVAALQFRMHFFHVDENLAVLCHQPALATARPGRQEQLLLANILRWLGRQIPDTATPRVFRWPLPGFGQADPSLAGSSLHAFVQQAASDSPFANLVVMGETVLDTLQIRLTPDDVTWRLYVTPGLTEMLNLPALKKDTWQKLIPLHAALSG